MSHFQVNLALLVGPARGAFPLFFGLLRSTCSGLRVFSGSGGFRLSIFFLLFIFCRRFLASIWIQSYSYFCLRIVKLKIEESNRLQGKEQKKSCEKAGQRLVDDFYIMKNLVERSRKSPTDLFRICSSSMTCARAAPCRTQDIPIPAKIKFCI